MFKKKMILLLISIGFILIFSTIGLTGPKLPGKGITIRPARATLDYRLFSGSISSEGWDIR